jgi:hypothetical protein
VSQLMKPAVVVITAEFEKIATAQAEFHGHAGLRMLILPYPLEGLSTEEVAQIAEDAYPRLLRTLGVRDGAD